MIRLERQNIDIPAGESAYVIEDRYVLPVDVELRELQPHAHYLARQVEGLARLPDGTSRRLIDIKDWDFAWQDVYRLAAPLMLPKGTTLVMRWRYDNSAGNARNPSRPPHRVRFGQKCADEMGSLWLQVLTRTHEDQSLLERQVHQKAVREDIVGFRQLLAADPDDPSLHENLAASYLALGEGDLALAQFQTVLRLKPDSAFCNNNMGKALLALGKPGEAIPYLQEALRLEIPNPASVYNSLGVALQQRGSPEDAVAHYRQALLLEPDSEFAHNNLGKTLQALGRFDEAIGHFERAAAIRPEDPIPHRNLGIVLVSENRIREAVAHFRLALDKRPDSVDLLMDLAWILAVHPDANLRSPAEAIRLADRAAELTAHREGAVLDILAAAFGANSQFDQAIVTAAPLWCWR